ncbi:MAG TPA: zinc-binding dehydrogenase [Gemmatimonadales bacterium]|nr:zinc-binding dehydrogenase [Gemmatimonadales bacterium]
MRALTLAALGGIEHLAVAEVPDPGIPAPDEIRVRVRAAALNRLDIFVANGLPKFSLPLPHVVGSDAAGVVESVGSAVQGVQVGDRVMLDPGVSCGECDACRRGDHPLCERYAILGEHRAGTIAEHVVIPAVNAAPVPEGMSWAEAAAFPLSTLTAWRMLTTRARLRAGETVLVWGAGGGVAQAAIRIARHLGAVVIATSGAPAKLELARRLGADHVVNHASEDVVAEVKRISGRRGAQVVVDSVGEKTWQRSLRCLSRGGRLVTCGATSGPIVDIDVRRLFWHQWSLLGSTMGSRAEFREIVALAHSGKLWPHVDRVLPLASAVEAFRLLAGGEQSGKLVIEVSS